MKNKHIPWFNPREMQDETVLALATGRNDLLQEILQAIRQRSLVPGQINHWLMTGPRGAGKSYFLRLLQAKLQQSPIENVRFVLLPEELPNIYAPHELLREITRMLAPNQNVGHIASWKVTDREKQWDEALQQLLASIPDTLLVVGIENFDDLIANAFSDEIDNSRLRHLMSNESRLMFVATSVQGDFDEKHAQRMFRQFEHRSMPRWNTQDHRDYLSARARLQGTVPTEQQLNRIDAYSRYTGGNARAAAVLAATILDVDDLTIGAQDLDAAIEKMSDYYRALINQIPANTRKLFDALVRGGEPASQTDIAERTGAKQNEISRAFAWLLDNGYVSETREAGQKAKQYRALDRLLVQFYRMRYLQPGQRSRLAVMADLLADMLSFGEKLQFATSYVQKELESAGISDEESVLRKSEMCVRQNEVVYEVANANSMAATATRPENAIAQRVGAIHDKFITENEAAAFALGLDLLHEIANGKHAEELLRQMWIMLIDLGTPFTLLHDLLGEWPRFWSNHSGVLQLQSLFQIWLADLQQSRAEKEVKRKTLDPDIATTLAALERALTPKARYRLALLV